MIQINEKLMELKSQVAGLLNSYGIGPIDAAQFLERPGPGFIHEQISSNKTYMEYLAEFNGEQTAQSETQSFIDECDQRGMQLRETIAPETQIGVTTMNDESIDCLVDDIEFLPSPKTKMTLNDIYSAYTSKKGLLYEVFMNSESYLRIGWNLMTKLKDTENDDSRLLGKLTVNFIKNEEKKNNISRTQYGFSKEDPKKTLTEEDKMRIISLADEIYHPVISFIEAQRIKSLNARINQIAYEDRKDSILKGVLVYLANNGLEMRYFEREELSALAKGIK